jgi:hypothetical protein
MAAFTQALALTLIRRAFINICEPTTDHRVMKVNWNRQRIADSKVNDNRQRS